MSNIAAFPSPHDDGGFEHCSADEYAAYLAGSGWSDHARKRKMVMRRRFVQAYPDLDAWLQRSLRERVGWQTNKSGNRRMSGPGGRDVTSDWINYQARPYLIYLALTGRLRLDWGWLLGIGVLHPWPTVRSLGVPLRDQANTLLERLEGLGINVDHEYPKDVHWGVGRLVLHRGDPELSAITSADVEQLRQAIRSAHMIPGMPDLLGPRIETTPVHLAQVRVPDRSRVVPRRDHRPTAQTGFDPQGPIVAHSTACPGGDRPLPR